MSSPINVNVNQDQSAKYTPSNPLAQGQGYPPPAGFASPPPHMDIWISYSTGISTPGLPTTRLSITGIPTTGLPTTGIPTTDSTTPTAAKPTVQCGCR